MRGVRETLHLRLAGSCLAAALAGSGASTVSAATFTNFESHQIHPLEISLDGTRLFACNTPDNRLTVYTITGGGLTLEAEVPVGLEPVSVRQRTATEVWVVNHLSDDVSVVDLGTMNVRASLLVGDEPTDIVFAGAAGRAFVCVSQEDAVKIYNPNDLAAAPVVVPIFGGDPRALAASPAGDKVYAAIFESGNLTSIIGEDEVRSGGGTPPPNPPMGAWLPAAPDVGIVIQWNGAHWVDETGTKNWDTVVTVPYTLADNDLAVLDADAPAPAPSYRTGIGTLNFGLAVRPGTGDIYVSNTEAFNLTRFEPNVKGRFAQNRVTIVPAGGGAPTPVHLNPHINYGVSPGPAGERALSLAQPNGMDWDAAGSVLYVAAVGSGKIAALDPGAGVVARADVGEGPTAVAVDDARSRVYVLNRFTNTVAIVSTPGLAVQDEVSLGYQPEPAVVTTGREFLYGARDLSAHGDLSCATCHAFANLDAVAWDLGNPVGQMQPSGQFGIPPFHPMKGPMTTQSLRGLAGTEPLHWRGDRAGFNNFNKAFLGLMGAPDTLAAAAMQAYTDFIMTVSYPPNPFQNLDRTYPNPSMPAGSAERGRIEMVVDSHDGGLRCQDCHDSSPSGDPFHVAPGTNGLIIPAIALQESQAFKVPQMRNLYEKTGFTDAAGPQKRGYGFVHDGSIDNLFTFLRLPVFQFASDQERRDLEAFALTFDTGMAPAVGAQQTVDALNKNLPAVVSRITTFMGQADAGNIDLVVKGRVGGLQRGYLYAGGGNFTSDRSSEAAIAEPSLRALAAAGAELTYTGVPPGNGARIGVDRDEDGYRDRDELDAGSNPADPSSQPATSVAELPGAAGGRGGLRLASSPNPATAVAGATLSFTLADAANVTLRILDVQGREVAALLGGERLQGTVTVRWDGRDARGRAAAAGVYYARLEAGGRSETRSVVLAR